MIFNFKPSFGIEFQPRKALLWKHCSFLQSSSQILMLFLCYDSLMHKKLPARYKTVQDHIPKIARRPPDRDITNQIFSHFLNIFCIFKILKFTLYYAKTCIFFAVLSYILIWTSNSWHYSCPHSVYYCWSIVFLLVA